MAKLEQPLNEVPSICMDLDDIKIIADHYGLDFGECRVITASNQIGMMGYCLIGDDGNVIDGIDWRHDEELIRKFYEHDCKCGFVEEGTSFEEYSEPYFSS